MDEVKELVAKKFSDRGFTCGAEDIKEAVDGEYDDRRTVGFVLEIQKD